MIGNEPWGDLQVALADGLEQPADAVVGDGDVAPFFLAP